ncbi:hypothetical protein HBP98_12000 [Listeria booriae]|uniref:Uncharacterized protein n=1 Tax=Listeria booriae TaxID=1552123 RepID=A0A7X1A917_9LIST|nr:hypothetical protein [Listeria booriae]MBC2372726.1 hypothetical protein [Listeria booriae]
MQSLSEDYGIAKATIYTWIKKKQTKEVKQNYPELVVEHTEMQKNPAIAGIDSPIDSDIAYLNRRVFLL